jgi:hypothetical protein
MSHNGSYDQVRPTIWVTPSHTNWTKGDTTTAFTLDIFNDEAKTQPRNLTGEQVFLIISDDYPYNERFLVEVTDKITDAVNGRLSSTFPKNAVNQTGEYKVETFVLDTDGTTRLYSHHIDFNIVA